MCSAEADFVSGAVIIYFQFRDWRSREVAGLDRHDPVAVPS
jgi:hypothetical protein